MAGEHPIQGLMQSAMENIREMVDVNTIIGSPVETPDGHVIIPVSKVGFGFAAGGSEFAAHKNETGEPNNQLDKKQGQQDPKNGKGFPFGGGSGGGVSITPVAFIVVGDKGIRLLNVDGPLHLYDRLIDSVPELLDRFSGLRKKKPGCSNEDQSGDYSSQTFN